MPDDEDFQVKPSPEILAALQKFAPLIDHSIPEGMGFALMIFDMNKQPTDFFYISNAERRTMLRAMKEFVDAQLAPKTVN